MGFLSKLKKVAGKAIDYTPGASNIKGLVTGNTGQALGGAGYATINDAAHLAGQGGIDNMLGVGKTDTSGVAGDQARNIELYKRALNQQAPQIQSQAGVGYGLDPTATRFSASQAETPADVVAPTIDLTRTIDSRDVNAPQLGAAREVEAPHLAPSALATASGVDAATIDKAASDQIRSRQLGYLDTLDAAAAGKAPSVAETSYLAKAGDVGREALGLAAQARGSNRASARSAAVREVADQQRRMALDSAMLRAGETTAARGQLGGALSDVRGTDVGLASKQAELTQGARTTTAELGTSVSQGNRDAVNGVNSMGAQLALKAAQGNQDAVNTRAFQQGTMTQATDVGNAERQQAAQLANQQALQARAIEQARQRQAAATQNQTIGAQLATTNAGLRQGASAAGAAAQNERALQVAQGTYTAEAGNRDAATGVATTNAHLTQAGQELSQSEAQAASNAASGNTATQIGVKQADAAGRRALTGAVLGGAATVATGGLAAGAGPVAAAATKAATSSSDNQDSSFENGTTSDARAKTDISRDSDKQVSDALKKIEMYSYRYKDPADGEGMHHGPMAQDLEQDPILRTSVSTGPDGKKMVNTSALSLIMAGLTARKLRQMEGRG